MLGDFGSAEPEAWRYLHGRFTDVYQFLLDVMIKCRTLSTMVWHGETCAGHRGSAGDCVFVHRWSSEVGDMSIERLHRAALAAGFAMAAPDDDPDMERDTLTRRADVPATANLPAVVSRVHRVDLRSIELLAPVLAFGSRLRGRLPHLRGGAAA
jgi:hypothetical protein